LVELSSVISVYVSEQAGVGATLEGIWFNVGLATGSAPPAFVQMNAETIGFPHPVCLSLYPSLLSLFFLYFSNHLSLTFYNYFICSFFLSLCVSFAPYLLTNHH
jgi:hypothetical protein